MSKFKLLVVEDEIVIADNICSILEKLGYEVLEPAIHYSDAIERIEEEQPDLALLDIQLAGSKDGIDLAWKIKEEYDFPFIFLTSNADPRTVERAKGLNPPAYLVKPFNRDDLYTSIELALHNYKAETPVNKAPQKEEVIIKDSFFIKDKHKFHKVKFSEICYLKSDHVYVELHTVSEKKHLIRSSMNDFIENLPENFYRTHRSYTINLDFLESINARFVNIIGVFIPFGMCYRFYLMKKIRKQFFERFVC